MLHEIHGQWAYLLQSELKQLKEELGIEPWRFEQFEHEAVFIPGGCPHEVRGARPPPRDAPPRALTRWLRPLGCARPLWRLRV